MSAFDLTFRRSLDVPNGAFGLPHWALGQEVRGRDIFGNWNQVSFAGGVRIGRPLPAARRIDQIDPTSDAITATSAERATFLDREIRIGSSDPGAARHAVLKLLKEGLISEVRPVTAQVFDRSPYKAVPSTTSGQPGSWALEAVGADAALALSPGDPLVSVAVVDSGIARNHAELRGRVRDGYDFVALGSGDWTGPGLGALIGDTQDRDEDWNDDGGHGSHVAGTIGARGLKMPMGVGGRSSLMAYRALGTAMENGTRVSIGVPSDITAAFKEATDRGAHVINLSLGGAANQSVAPYSRVIRYARMRNVVLVAASGNHGSDVAIYPGAVPGVITVGAIDPFGRVAAFSGWGPNLDVVAPGTSIYSADLNNGYRYRDGTSHAAPFVSATAALIIGIGRSRDVTFKESTIRNLIRGSAQRVGRQGDPRGGAGVLNMARAVEAASRLIDDHRQPSLKRKLPLPFGFGPRYLAS